MFIHTIPNVATCIPTLVLSFRTTHLCQSLTRRHRSDPINFGPKRSGEADSIGDSIVLQPFRPSKVRWGRDWGSIEAETQDMTIRGDQGQKRHVIHGSFILRTCHFLSFLVHVIPELSSSNKRWRSQHYFVSFELHDTSDLQEYDILWWYFYYQFYILHNVNWNIQQVRKTTSFGILKSNVWCVCFRYLRILFVALKWASLGLP
jgi:hypothetical protein